MSGRFGIVDVLAFGTIKANGAGVRDIVLTGREKRMAFARNTGTFSEIALLVLVNLNSQLVSNTSLRIGTATAYHFGETTGSDNVAGMDKSVQVASRFLDLLTKVVVRIEVENVGHEVQCILIVRDLGVKAGKVETIGQVFLVDFAKVLVSAGRNELGKKVRLGSWKSNFVGIALSQGTHRGARFRTRFGLRIRPFLI